MTLSIQTLKTNEKQSWQLALANLVSDPKELLGLLDLDLALLDAAHLAGKAFSLKVPRSYVARMQKGNARDPLLLQILPLVEEMQVVSGYELDPLQEINSNPISGMLHKYHGRVLVTLTSACATHCRYCFRRHFPYADNNPGREGWKKIFSYIQDNPTISEVILSGGDPLTVNDFTLQSFSEQLEKIPHIKRLRIHTRLPIVLPERITENFCNWAKQLAMPITIVVHANHAQEINEEVITALNMLRSVGVHLLNQTVLLKGINDEAKILIDLSESLFAAGVIPYYLHVLDKVQGAAHFDMTLEKARYLHAEMKKHLPGYLVPRLALEEAGEVAKTLL